MTVNSVSYTYLSDGTKAAARAGGSSSKAGLRYRGSFVYDVDAGGSESLQSIAVPTGRLVAVHGSGSSVSFESDAFVSDHLGNVTAVVNLSAPESTPTDNAILEQSVFLPFGTRIPLRTQAANRYRYAGKEEQDIAGHDLHLIDFGARFYDTFSCRWNAPDPLAGRFSALSPYNYCGNNPVNFFDPDGRTDYLFDEYGNYTKQENDDPYDRVYISNGNSMLIKDKSILSNLSERRYIPQTDDSVIEKALVYLTTNADISLVSQVFGFIQNNSSVEWGLFHGQSGNNMLGTTKDGSRIRESALFFYADADKENPISPIESKIHGHPKEGADREIPSMEADIINCKITPDIHSYVMSGTIYKVSENGAHKVSNYNGWGVK